MQHVRRAVKAAEPALGALARLSLSRAFGAVASSRELSSVITRVEHRPDLARSLHRAERLLNTLRLALIAPPLVCLALQLAAREQIGEKVDALSVILSRIATLDPALVDVRQPEVKALAVCEPGAAAAASSSTR